MRGNSISIKGNITRDMEVRRTQSGNNACSWGIAWNSRRKNQQGEYEDVPHFFDVECWASDKQLDMLRPGIVKGARCAIVDGHLEQPTWESNGVKRSKVVIRVDDPIGGVLAVSGRHEAQPVHAEVIDAGTGVYDDDIPF